MARNLTSIDLFVGAGGLTQGFKQQGFSCLWANDFDEEALCTFSENHPEVTTVSGPIEAISPAEVRNSLGLARGELDVVLGGPPCQGFSTYGKRDPNDDRNKLPRYFLDFVQEFMPKVFVMENVVGILSMEGGRVVEGIVSRATGLGYACNPFILDAVEYGVPQFRKRVFVVGSRAGHEVEKPQSTHGTARRTSSNEPEQSSLFENLRRPRVEQAVTVRDAISDLPTEALPPRRTSESVPYATAAQNAYQQVMRQGSGKALHHSAKQMLGVRRLRMALLKPGDYGTELRHRILENGLPDDIIDELLGGRGLRDLSGCRTQDKEKELELRKILHRGHIDIDKVLDSVDHGGFANKYRRLEWDAPSHTLVAHMARDCSDFIHPEVDRFISVREAARLQSFPDTYRFLGSQFRQFKQIGNAVPPMLGEAVARAVKNHLGYQTF